MLSLRRASSVAFAFLSALLLAAPLHAQYIYIDVNGDGVHTSADCLDPSALTPVGIWLDTVHNKNGTLGACATGAVNSFDFIIHAVGGTVTWGTFTLTVAFTGITTGVPQSATEYHTVAATTSPVVAGLYKLGTLDVQVASGTPSLEFAAATTLSNGFFTSFGTSCLGTKFDNTFRLGTEWLDADGLSACGPLNTPPTLTLTGPPSVDHNQTLCIDASATDPDVTDLLTIQYVGGGPSSLTTFTHTPSVSPATGSLCGTLGCADVGNWTLTFSVSDGVNPAVLQQIDLAVTNGSPTVLAPATASVITGQPLSFGISAADPEGDALTLQAAGTAISGGAGFSDNGNGTGAFQWTPPCVAGTFDAIFTAADACGATGSATTAITVDPVPGTRHVGGEVFFDANGDATGTCTPGLGEGRLFGWIIRAYDANNNLVVTTWTQSFSSVYGFALPQGGKYRVCAEAPYATTSAYWTQSCPPIPTPTCLEVDLTCSLYALGMNFGEDDAGSFQNLLVSGGVDAKAKQGSTLKYLVGYRNLGTVAVTGATVDLELPNQSGVPLVNFLGVATPGFSYSAPTITWTPSAPVPPGAFAVLSADVEIPTTVPVGTQLNAKVTISPTSGDVAPADNVGSLTSVVVSSLDPNVKEVFPEGHTLRSTPLRYHIKFQNTGTAAADKVVVRDVLDPDLDPDTIQPLMASHDCGLAFENGELVWTCEGINLADSTANEPESHGFVDFEVMPRATVLDGTLIENRAAIYFDFNPPVLTNTTVNVIDSPPGLNPPTNMFVEEGQVANQPLSASDPEADPLTFTLVSGPPYAAVTTTGPTTGNLRVAPGSSDAGPPTAARIGVSDGLLSDIRALLITILDVAETRAFTTARNKAIRLQSSRATWCVELEPVANSFRISDVSFESIVLRSPGTGSVSEIPAVTGKSTVVADRDNNEISDFEVCFRREDVRALFSNVSGHQMLPLVCEGDLIGGGRIRVDFVQEVFGGGSGAVTASVSPNPLNPQAVLTVWLAKPGPATVKLFDLRGGLVRTLLNEPMMSAGYHDIRIDGRNGRGAPLASGVYFYQVESEGETVNGRLAILR